MKKVKKIIVGILLFISTFIFGVIVTFLIIEKHPNTFLKTVTKLEKDVTVIENSIADAVSKVYDSVIIVSTISQNKIINRRIRNVYNNQSSCCR